MKRKSLLLCLALVLSIAMAISGTLAYLTDTETTTNVMTVGNVDVELTEWERAKEDMNGVQTVAELAEMVTNDTLNPFTNHEKLLYPVVLADENYRDVKGAMWSSKDVAGVVDKIVQVANTGTSDAYFRVALAFPQIPEMDKMLHINWNETNYKWTKVENITLSDERVYTVYLGTYQEILPAGQIAPMSLLQVYLDSEATNATMAEMGEKYRIRVAVQAAQNTNFDDVVAASGIEGVMTKVFGDVTNEKNPWTDADLSDQWDGEIVDTNWYDTNPDATEFVLDTAGDVAGLAQLVNAGNNFEGKTITLTEDVNMTAETGKFLPIGYSIDEEGKRQIVKFKGTFDGAGKKISGFRVSAEELGDAMPVNAGLFYSVENATVKNLTLDGFYLDNDGGAVAAVAAAVYGTSLFENITVTNSTFTTNNNTISALVGDVYSNSNVTFRNITFDASNKFYPSKRAVGTTEGDWRTSSQLSAFVGCVWDETVTLTFENCHVAANFDAYNRMVDFSDDDLYAYSGAFVGWFDAEKNVEGNMIPDLSKVTMINCSVDFGDAHEFYYCNLGGDEIHRVGKDEITFDADGNITGCVHVGHTADAVYRPFRNLFGIDTYCGKNPTAITAENVKTYYPNLGVTVTE